VAATTPISVSEPRARRFGAVRVVRRARELPLRWRFLTALLAVIALAETVIVVTFYDQRHEHSISEQLVSLGQRMHEISDLQFGVAQLALQRSPVDAREIGQLRLTLRASEVAVVRAGAAWSGSAIGGLERPLASLVHTRASLDRLPSDAPRRAALRRRLIAQASALTARIARLHRQADARILAAQASTHASERDASRTFLAGSALSLLAAVALALLLARAVSRPVARLAAGARQLGAGRLGYRLAAESRDEIGVVASEFNRMAAQLQEAHATLEARVHQRTQELAHANRELDANRAEHERLARQRRMLLGRVITAQEEERQRIARELHDEAGQSLTALSLGLEAAGDELRSGRRERLGARLRSLAHVAADAIEDLDRLVLDLRPAQLDRLGLLATLRWYVARVRAQSGVRVRLVVTGPARRLGSEVETALFRIAQEALTNVVRHARASRAEVALAFDADAVRLEVSDDGAGFDTEATGREPTSVGLIGMRERAELVGGTLVARSSPQEGTRLTVRIPFGSGRG
jgi:signal transduction histidine kinase